MNRIVLALLGLLFSTLFVQAQTGDRYPMSEDEVYLIQVKLYELNYDVEPDGKLGPETMAAISKMQTNIDQPATGFLTKDEYDLIIEQDTSGVWGSIAASTDGAARSVWNYSTRAESEREALAGCVSNSSSPEKCIVVTGKSWSPEVEAWVAAVQCKTEDGDTRYSYISIVARRERSDALSEAYVQAENDGYGRSQCNLRSIIEARGRHE